MEKNKYLKIWIFSVIFLLGLCFIGIGTEKGTSAVTEKATEPTCPSGYEVKKYFATYDPVCCPTSSKRAQYYDGKAYCLSYTKETDDLLGNITYSIRKIDNKLYCTAVNASAFTIDEDVCPRLGTSWTAIDTSKCQVTMYANVCECKSPISECATEAKAATCPTGTDLTYDGCVATTGDSSGSSRNCYITEEGNYVWMDDSRDEFATEEGGTFKKVDNSKCESSGSTTKTCFKCSTDSNNTKYDVNAPTSGCAGTWQSTQESACDKTYTAQFKDTASSYTKQTTCTIKASETDTKTTCGAPLPTEKPQQEGKTFKGWTETSNTCNNPKTTGTISVGKNGKTLYACWETSVKVTFNPTSEGTISGKNKGETKDFTCTYKSGEDSCKLSENPTATISGREFLGWSKSSECTEYTKDIKSIEFKENTTFTACYAEPVAQDKTVKATFDANGGILSGKTTDTCTIISGNSSCKITNLPTATYTGKTFGGWGGSKTCQSGQMNEVNLTANKTFYACWNEINDGDDEPPLDEPSEEPSDKPSINPPYNQDDDDQNDDDNQNDNNQNVDNNPGTGEIAIFIVWIAAFFAIGYSIYYYKEIKGN